MKALLRNLLFAMALLMTGLGTVQAQQNAPSDSETALASTKMDVDNNPLLKKYSWLKNIVNREDCKGENVSLYYHETSKSSFIFIESNGSKIMYNEAGQVYCKDSKTLDCAKYYELEKQDESWSCSNHK